MSEPAAWEGRVVAVTGASAGLGAEVARLFGTQGASVGLLARSEERLRAVAAQIRTGPTAVAPADVVDEEATRAALESIEGALGPIDVLVNNAGIGLYRPFLDTSAEDLQRLWAVNVAGAAHAMRAVLPAMLERHRGVVVNVASVAGRIGVPQESAYSASKFALVGLSESVAAELGGTGVSIRLVDPGPVATEFFDRRGAPYARRLPRPMPAATVARRIVAAARRGSGETYVPSWLGAAVAAKTLLPCLYRLGVGGRSAR